MTLQVEQKAVNANDARPERSSNGKERMLQMKSERTISAKTSENGRE